MEISQGIEIIFIGTPEFGAIVLEGLIKNDLRPVLVITAPDKPVGRKQILTPSSVKVIAEKYNVPVSQIVNLKNSTSVNLLSKEKPDLIIVAAYGQILPKEILDIPKYGCLNIHPSLLPKYRGPSPIQATILNDETEIGVSIIKMVSRVDAGPIVAKSKIQIPKSKITYLELHDELADLGARLLVKTIPDWLEGKIKPAPQDEARATYTKILTRQDGKIDWKKPAEYIERQIGAFNPEPGTFCLVNGKVLKIIKAGIQEQTKAGPFGSPGKTYLATNDKIACQTGKNFLIIEELQLEGKKPTAASAFIKGHKDFIGTVLN